MQEQVPEKRMPILFLEDETEKVAPVEKKEEEKRTDWLLSQDLVSATEEKNLGVHTGTSLPAFAISTGFLARPKNIYAEEPNPVKPSSPEQIPVKDPISGTIAVNPLMEEEPSPDLQLVFKDIPAADVQPVAQACNNLDMSSAPRSLRCRTRKRNKGGEQQKE